MGATSVEGFRADLGQKATALVPQPRLARGRLVTGLDDAVLVGFGFEGGPVIRHPPVQIEILHDLMLRP